MTITVTVDDGTAWIKGPLPHMSTAIDGSDYATDKLWVKAISKEVAEALSGVTMGDCGGVTQCSCGHPPSEHCFDHGPCEKCSCKAFKS